MKRITVAVAVLGLFLAAAVASQQSQAQAQMMDPGMGGQGMMAPGMGGVGPGVIYGWPDPTRNELTVDDVRMMLERQLDWHRNPRLKVGTVAEKDDDTIIAEIVTVDDSLVQRIEVGRHTGLMRQVH